MGSNPRHHIAVALLLLLAGGVSGAELEGAGGPTLLALDKASGTLAFVDPSTLAVDTTIAVGDFPHEVAVSADGRLAYVSNYGDRESPGNTLSVVDVPARRLVGTIVLEGYRRPHGLALTRDGRRLYVTVEANRAVLEVDVAGARVARVFPTGEEISHMVALAPDESRLYVTSIGSGALSVFRLADGATTRVPLGKGPEGLAVSPDGRFLWVANRSDGELVVLDTATDRAVDTLAAGEFPIRVAFTPDGGRVLVSDARGDGVAVFDAETRRLLARVPTGEMPIGILVEPDGAHFWVAQSERGRVTRFDLTGYEEVGHVIAGREPDGLGWARPRSAPAGAPAGE